MTGVLELQREERKYSVKEDAKTAPARGKGREQREAVGAFKIVSVLQLRQEDLQLPLPVSGAVFWTNLPTTKGK